MEFDRLEFFFFSSRRRHTRYWRDWSSDVCSSDLVELITMSETEIIVRKVSRWIYQALPYHILSAQGKFRVSRSGDRSDFRRCGRHAALEKHVCLESVLNMKCSFKFFFYETGRFRHKYRALCELIKWITAWF